VKKKKKIFPSDFNAVLSGMLRLNEIQ